MSRRTKTIIIILILWALLMLILWLLLRQQAPAPEEGPVEDISGTVSKPLGGQLDTTYSANVNTAKKPPVTPAAPTNEAPLPPPDVRSNLKRLAAAFSERYGSFSNTSDYENLLDLKAFMTQSMADTTDDYVANARATVAASGDYFGMTTRALATDVRVLDETSGTADVVVTTQRHSSGTLGERIYYQDINVQFIKAGDVWKVSAAAWQPAQ